MGTLENAKAEHDHDLASKCKDWKDMRLLEQILYFHRHQT